MDLKTAFGLNNFSFNLSPNTITYTIYFLIAIAFFGMIIWYLSYKKTYKYNVRIFRMRDNGNVKEINCKGGYINRANGSPFFRLKLGMFSNIDLTETPKLQFIDEEDRIYYKQIDINTFIQVKRKFGDEGFLLTPVESDVKYGAILSVQRIRDTLNQEPTWKKILPYAGLIIMAIVFVISYYMLMDKCSGG